MSDNFNKADSNFQKSESSKLHMHHFFPYFSDEGKKFLENTPSSDVFSAKKSFETTTQFWMNKFPDFFKKLSQYIDACSKSGYSSATFLTERSYFQAGPYKELRGQRSQFFSFLFAFLKSNGFSVNLHATGTTLWTYKCPNGIQHNIKNLPHSQNIHVTRQMKPTSIIKNYDRRYSRIHVRVDSPNQLVTEPEFEVKISDNHPLILITHKMEYISMLDIITISWRDASE